MLDPLLTLLAAKASSMGRTVGLVAGTAMVTTALVGGGAVAMTSVSSETALTSESAMVSTSATPTVGIGSATPTATIKPGKPPVPTVAFTCDPTENHGQNVSAYGRTVASGPGRGRQISAAARSDCGKKVKTAEATADATTGAPKPAKTKAAKAARAAKPVKPAKPAKAAKPAKPGKPAKPAKAAETDD